MPQDLIADRYRVERAVGKGGMGTVWLCHDEVLNRAVAVKQIGVVAGESADDTRRAMREARTTAALNHRNAVSIYDVVDHKGAPWLVMEYVPSRTLSELIKQGPLPAGRVAAIGAQVAAALAAAHLAGIIHRDVKPGNILVGEDDLAKISDFGIARITHDEQLTQTGMMSGTPSYFSPELARGGDPGPESDAWALGATLYAAVEGHPPHPKQPNAIATITAIASEPVPRPLRAGVLLEPIGHLMDPDPAARWTMAEAEDALRRLAARSGTTTTPASPPTAPRPVGPVATAAPVPRAAPVEPVTQVDPPTQGEPARTPSQRGSRFFPVALVLAALLLVGIAAVVLVNTLRPEDPPAGTSTDDEPTSSSSASPSASESPDESPTEEETPEETPKETAEPTPTETTEESPNETPDPPAPGPAAAQVETVETYFATVPADLDAGWAQLAPSFQARVGRDSYDGFWATISDVEVADVEAGGGDTVSAQVTYTGTDGSTSVEQQTLTLVPAGDGYLIAADR